MPSSKEIRPTIGFVDEYCQQFEGLFPEVCSFEAFKFLYLGLVSQIKRKSLSAIAKAVGLENSQSLHHLLGESERPLIASESIGANAQGAQGSVTYFTDR
jgi:SRSO17 transposase